MIVPFAAGGPTDLYARLIASKMSEQAGKSFYIENVGGAGGNAGSARAAQSAPDGYTLLVTGGSHVNNQFLYSHVPYDPFRDFEAVTLGAIQPIVLAVNPSVPAQTAKELVALVKASPGKYSFASPGVGTPPSLVGELFRLSYAPDLVHVPFNGGGPAVGSTVAGHTPASFGALAPAVPMIKDGKLRALAVSSKTRTPTLPDVPTMAEAGYPDLTVEVGYFFLAPAGTPKPAIDKLSGAITAALRDDKVWAALAVQGVEKKEGGPEQTRVYLADQLRKWDAIVKQSAAAAK
jgi:tripartite-type tricarboxylate transporter receptor subunit TctC